MAYVYYDEEAGEWLDEAGKQALMQRRAAAVPKFADWRKQNSGETLYDVTSGAGVDFESLFQKEMSNPFSQMVAQQGGMLSTSTGPNQLYWLDPVSKKVFRSAEIGPNTPWGADPSNDFLSGKDGWRDAAMIAGMAAPIWGGALLGAAGTAGGGVGQGIAGTAGFEAGAAGLAGAETAAAGGSLLDFVGSDAVSGSFGGTDAMAGGPTGVFDASGAGAFDGLGNSFDAGAFGGMDAGAVGGANYSGAATAGGVLGGAGASSLPFGLTAGDLAKAGLNFGVNAYLGNRAGQQANEAATQGNALEQAQRAPFQNAALGMVQNPQDYLTNNPFATALTSHYKNNVIPTNIAKSGNTGFEADRLGGQFATALGANYNELLGTLMGYGGFNQGTGYSAVVAGQGAQQQNQFNAEAFRGLGNIAEKVFGTPTQPKAPQQNPVTGSYVLPQ